MDVLRTPDSRFEHLVGYPFAPHYVDVTAGDTQPLRMHYVARARATVRRSSCCTASPPGVICTEP